MAAVATAAALCGAALFGIASTVAVVLRPHSVWLSAGLSVAVALGYALTALWVCLALRRLGLMRDGGDGAGGEGWGREAHGPNRPQPPSDEPELWPELERELRAYLEAHEREPVAG